MTNFTTTALITFRRLRMPPAPAVPTTGFGASLEAITRLIGDALIMAYVDPFITRARSSPEAQDTDLKGRDPKW